MLSTHLSAQTTITYSDGQTDAAGHSVAAPNDPTTLRITTGTATQGGTIAAGNSIGTFALNGLSLTSATSHLALEIDLGVLAADLLNVTGTISLNGSTLDLTLFNVSPTGLTETFIFASNDLSDAVSGTFGTITGVPFQYRATVNNNFTGVDSLGRVGNGNELALMLEFVPEPASMAAPLAAMLGLLTIRRRARR